MTSPLDRRAALAAAPADDAQATHLRTRVEPRLAAVRQLPEVQASILLALRQRLQELAHDTNHSEGDTEAEAEAEESQA